MLRVLAHVDKVCTGFVCLSDPAVTSEHVPHGARHTCGVGNVAVEILIVPTANRHPCFIDHQRTTSFASRHRFECLHEQRVGGDIEHGLGIIL